MIRTPKIVLGVIGFFLTVGSLVGLVVLILSQ